jgi:ABC-2 type transport system permease protein
VSTTSYLKYETLRTVRNKQSFGFSLVFPIVMYLLLAAPNRNDHSFGDVPGLFAPQYYMISLLGFGSMIAVLSCGARIAAERTIGWNRQLRITPLSVRDYLAAKVGVGYLLALIAMALLYIAGAALGVRLSASAWVIMSLLVLLALVPFAALGIALGHLLNADAAGPAMGGGVSLLAFLGGTWFPITGGWFADLCKLLPSWWLVQAGHVGLSGGPPGNGGVAAGGGSHNPWGVEGWIVLAFWTITFSALAMWAFRRDTARA